MERIADDQNLEVLQPELGTKPRVWYKNLWRFSKAFIGGSVSSEFEGRKDCVEGATVLLSKETVEIATTQTDNYGDFKFDRLDENSGNYEIKILADGHAPKLMSLELTNSKYLGDICL